MISLFFDHTFLVVLIGTVTLGAVAGAMGSFAVLRKQSLLGDCIAHAALPGICIAFLLTLSKSSIFLLFGAIIAGLIATIFYQLLMSQTILKSDTVLGLILSVFFGFGLFLLTYIQKLPLANQSGLFSYLFGSASTMLYQDVIVMFVLALIIFSIVILFWKEFKLITFDADYGKVLGFPTKRLEFLLTFLIVLAIVIGLQTVGVILMSAMVIAPAVAARQWTDRLGIMVILAGVFAVIASVCGVIISGTISNIPTGPVIVLMISFIVVISLLFSPNRGLLWSLFRHHRQRFTIREETLLSNLLLFSETGPDLLNAHDMNALESIGQDGNRRIFERLKEQGFVHSPQVGFWGLTEKGLKKAQSIHKDIKS
tara:strand:- start:279 stop:1385 length:1107 start_codon:yes stop_codon:yes gene_type:complete